MNDLCVALSQAESTLVRAFVHMLAVYCLCAVCVALTRIIIQRNRQNIMPYFEKLFQ